MRCPAPLEIQSYVDGELSGSQANEVAGHLRRCPSCQRLARDLSATATLLGALAEVPARPARPFAAASTGRAVRSWRRRLRWALLPAAASLILTAAVARRHFLPPEDREFVSAFIQAHRQMAPAELLPEPCDFGMGGLWP